MRRCKYIHLWLTEEVFLSEIYIVDNFRYLFAWKIRNAKITAINNVSLHKIFRSFNNVDLLLNNVLNPDDIVLVSFRVKWYKLGIRVKWYKLVFSFESIFLRVKWYKLIFSFKSIFFQLGVQIQSDYSIYVYLRVKW